MKPGGSASVAGLPVFFLVGPTAVGKSELAAEVAARCEAEVVNADAYQIYRGLDRLTGKPEPATLAQAPHHLLSAVSPREEMNAEKFRDLAQRALEEIFARGKNAVVAGGSGLYVKALTHGLAPLPPANPEIRARLNRLTNEELCAQLEPLDAEVARTIDRKNKRRLVRALEICLLTNQPASSQRPGWAASEARGVFIFREREQLYERINQRVEKMFADGVVEEVRAAEELSATAEQTLGVREIRALLAGNLSRAECIAALQQATRRYAKRQLTWFRRQNNFEPLNLSLHGSAEAIEWIARKARLCFATHD